VVLGGLISLGLALGPVWLARAQGRAPVYLPRAAREAVTAWRWIGPEGGTLSVAAGDLAGLRLEVPPGAVDGPTRFAAQADSLVPASAGPLGEPVALGPGALRLRRPVTLTLPLDPARLPAGVQPLDLVVVDHRADPGPGRMLRPLSAGSRSVSVAVSALSTFLIARPQASSLRIAEVAPSGGRLQDEDGDRPDWLELHNAGPTVLDLRGYTLTDDRRRPGRWRLPDARLAPGDRRLVFASGKDRPSGGPGAEARPAHHWETAVQDGSPWRYLPGAAEIAPDWTAPGFAADGWRSGPGGIGYGDRDDQSEVDAGTTSVFARAEFTVTDRSAIVALRLIMDYDDGFVAYLNGVEVARAGLEGSPPAWNALAAEHEASLYQGQPPPAFPLDPTRISDLLVAGRNVLAIQVHNVAPDSSDLSLRPFLLVGLAEAARQFADNPPWFVPPITGTPWHANFKLKPGETLSAFGPDGTLADAVAVRGDLQPGHVMVRQAEAWCIGAVATPGTAYDGPCFAGYAPAPVFSPPGGFYREPQTVRIQGEGLRLALGGDLPAPGSPGPAGPLAIAATTVLRAVATAPGHLPSEVVTAVYFLDEPTALPVVSVVARPADLFNGTGGEGPAIYDNYDSGLKVPAHVSYFDAAKRPGFAENGAARVVGNFSTAFAQKSLQLTFEEDFGARGDVPNVLFAADKPGLGPLHGFRVRNTDDDATSARMRDAVANRLALGTLASATASQNVAVFLNGAYWGHYVARELLNEHFVRDNYGADPDAVDIVKTHVGETFADAGSRQDFDALRALLATADLTQDAQLAAVRQRADLDNWADYWATQVFIANGDWYSSIWNNNTQAFRARPPGDGRWRFVLWDCAYSQGGFGAETAADFDSLGLALASPRTENLYTPMFNRLLTNAGFRRHFINRFADLLNGPWATPTLQALIDANAQAMASEVGPNHARWHIACGDAYCPPDLERWAGEVDRLKAFYDDRPAHQRRHLVAHFGLVKPVEIGLAVEPAGAGGIRISTLTPEIYPWHGWYFDGNPVTVTALPEPGYAFAGWRPSAFVPEPNQASFTANVTEPATVFTARFIRAATDREGLGSALRAPWRTGTGEPAGND
jgi:hypothetical protein